MPAQQAAHRMHQSRHLAARVVRPLQRADLPYPSPTPHADDGEDGSRREQRHPALSPFARLSYSIMSAACCGPWKVGRCGRAKRSAVLQHFGLEAADDADDLEQGRGITLRELDVGGIDE